MDPQQFWRKVEEDKRKEAAEWEGSSVDSSQSSVVSNTDVPAAPISFSSRSSRKPNKSTIISASAADLGTTMRDARRQTSQKAQSSERASTITSASTLPTSSSATLNNFQNSTSTSTNPTANRTTAPSSILDQFQQPYARSLPFVSENLRGRLLNNRNIDDVGGDPSGSIVDDGDPSANSLFSNSSLITSPVKPRTNTRLSQTNMSDRLRKMFEGRSTTASKAADLHVRFSSRQWKDEIVDDNASMSSMDNGSMIESNSLFADEVDEMPAGAAADLAPKSPLRAKAASRKSGISRESISTMRGIDEVSSDYSSYAEDSRDKASLFGDEEEYEEEQGPPLTLAQKLASGRTRNNMMNARSTLEGIKNMSQDPNTDQHSASSEMDGEQESGSLFSHDLTVHSNRFDESEYSTTSKILRLREQEKRHKQGLNDAVEVEDDSSYDPINQEQKSSPQKLLHHLMKERKPKFDMDKARTSVRFNFADADSSGFSEDGIDASNSLFSGGDRIASLPPSPQNNIIDHLKEPRPRVDVDKARTSTWNVAERSDLSGFSSPGMETSNSLFSHELTSVVKTPASIEKAPERVWEYDPTAGDDGPVPASLTPQATASAPEFLVPEVPTAPRPKRTREEQQYVFEELKTPIIRGRPVRKRFAPLDYARNERVVYGFSDPRSSMKSVVGVIRNVSADPSTIPKKKKAIYNVADAGEYEVLDAEKSSVESRTIALPQPSWRPIVEGNTRSLIADSFGCVTGWIKLLPGAFQQFNADPEQSKVFFVSKGVVTLKIADGPESKLHANGAFIIPRSNVFTVKNITTGSMPAVLAFVALEGDHLPSKDYV